MESIFDLFKRISSEREKTGKPEWLIVGLGNPGIAYEKTRHNVGFLALDRLAEEIGADIKKSRFQGLTGKALLGNTPVLLLKPMTYMNNSGHAVGEAADYYRISPDHVIVLVDDVHLGSGLIRIRKSGSDGGHNGLKDIENALGTDEYPRVRFGVGEKSHPEMELKDWVLGKLTESEMEGLRPAFEKTGEICRLLIAGEAEKAMGLFNGKALEK